MTDRRRRLLISSLYLYTGFGGQGVTLPPAPANVRVLQPAGADLRITQGGDRRVTH